MNTANFPSVRFGAGPDIRGETCHICMHRIDSRDPSATHDACHHSFHHDCFEHWHQTREDALRATTCPMCRAELNNPHIRSIHLGLTDYEIEEGIARLTVSRGDPPPRPEPRLPWLGRHVSLSHRHESHGARRPAQRPEPYRYDSSSGSSRYRHGSDAYDPIERMDYPHHSSSSSRYGHSADRYSPVNTWTTPGNPAMGGHAISRSSSHRDPYQSSSGARHGRLWEDIYELEG